MGDVLSMGNQPLMEVAAQQGDAVRPRMMPEKVASEADLTASAGDQNALI